MNTASDLEKLIQAVNRNTAATRAIATFLLGFIPWGIAGLPIVAFGLFRISSWPYDGVAYVAVGSLVILVGAIVTIVRAFGELKRSK